MEFQTQIINVFDSLVQKAALGLMTIQIINLADKLYSVAKYLSNT